MAKVKKSYISVQKDGYRETRQFDVFVNSSGFFYCDIDSDLEEAASEISSKENDFKISYSTRKGKEQAFSESLDNLEKCLYRVLDCFFNVEKIIEHVIRYNIESHISFAKNSDTGEIFGNATKKGFEWIDSGLNTDLYKEYYGGHNSTNVSDRGYKLIVGAGAFTKETLKYGDKEKIKYSRYYGGDSHLSSETPAALLNTWTSYSLPDDCKEMEYSEDAALFFHKIMLGMAELSQLMQTHFQDETKLMNLIASSGNLLPNKMQQS